jgi:hypothetical protein
MLYQKLYRTMIACSSAKSCVVQRASGAPFVRKRNTLIRKWRTLFDLLAVRCAVYIAVNLEIRYWNSFFS